MSLTPRNSRQAGYCSCPYEPRQPSPWAVTHFTAFPCMGGYAQSWRRIMETHYSYSAHAHWTQHKRGILEVADIPRTINFAAPPEFGGEPGLWTPEHLLVGAVATCYVATFRAIAEHSKLSFHGMDVRVEGTLEKQEGGFRFTRIVLRP